MKQFYRIFFTFLLSLLAFSCTHEEKSAFIDDFDPDAIDITYTVPAAAIEEHAALTEKTGDDWLLLFYLDGDNYKNDLLFRQMAQIAKGLKKITKKDGVTTKGDFANIKAVGLWDGFNEDSTFTPKYYLPNSFLFEFKVPEQKITDEIVENYKNFATDVSSEVLKSNNNWLSSVQEVNMGSKSTLSGFISWAENKYNSTGARRTVLIITGTGGGSFGTETGSYIPLDSRSIDSNLSTQISYGSTFYDNNEPKSRATARDYSSKSDYLTAGEISEALEENGFSNENKLELLIIDSAFSSSIEDCFEYKDYVSSLIATPSDAPGGAIDFNYLIQTFKKGTTIYDIGCEITTVYANKNYKNQEKLSDKGMASISFLDLRDISHLAENTTLLADKILKRNTNPEDYKEEIDRSITLYECMNNKTYGFFNFNENAENNITDYGMFYKSEYYHDIPDYDYFWGYIHQYDLGYFSHVIARLCESNAVEDVYFYCNNIKQNLQNIIVSSWRNGNNTKEGIYPALENTNVTTNGLKPKFGLTITGPARVQSKEYLQPYNFSEFKFKNYRYNDEENTGNWRDLLFSLYPEQFQETNFYVYIKS